MKPRPHPTDEITCPSAADVVEFVARRAEQRMHRPLRRRPADISDAWDWYLSLFRGHDERRDAGDAQERKAA
jgi:hypothetical protein